jgi:cytochrome c oxidase assembly protein subunit 15
MTGSGMGCPDWPKCFGYYIPPTSQETLTWSPEREFSKGNIIILNEELLVATKDFTTTSVFEPANWAPYTKHDYAIFNPTHTWVEFINRLIGAFTGLPVLLLFLLSLAQIKRDIIVSLVSFVGVVLLGFQAWLGKIVVDGNLVPHQITYHMLGAVLLIAVYVYLVVRLRKSEFSFRPMRDRRIVVLGVVSIALILVQILLGTTVREEVDAIGKGELQAMPNWIDALSIIFKVHRSFSLVVLGVVGWFAVKIIRSRTISLWPRLLLVFVVLEILIGMGLAYFNLPGFLQPLHLLFAVFDFALILGLLLVYADKTNPSKISLAI